MARILPILSSYGNSTDDPGLRNHLWVQILDGNRIAQSEFSVCDSEFSNLVAGLQFGRPRWGAAAAYFERRVQWDGSVGAQFFGQRSRACPAVEVLCENHAFGQTKISHFPQTRTKMVIIQENLVLFM